MPSPLYAALALALNATILLGFTWLWRRHGRGHRYILAELLPGRRGFVVLTMLLALFYLVTGLTLRPEIVPSLGPQVSIWILYLVYGWLLVIHMRRSRRFPAEDAAAPASGDLPPSPWPLVGLVVVTFITAAVVTRVILPGSMIFLQAGWLIGILSGVGLFVAGVWQAMRA
ncbi:MAG: hypothetical protein M1457_07975 [bacterium]|nr:hypothetical protein [bacterium]